MMPVLRCCAVEEKCLQVRETCSSERPPSMEVVLPSLGAGAFADFNHPAARTFNSIEAKRSFVYSENLSGISTETTDGLN
jgi:hypothetical protein